MKRWLSAVLFALVVVVSANSQTFRGAINGNVTDPSGGAVAGATVKATEKATGIVHTTVTTSDGAYAFQDIPLGAYSVNVVASGFSGVTVDNVMVSAGQVYTLPITLKIGQSATTVEVSAAAVALDTTSATQSMTISSDVVQDVPLNGRDFTQLIAVAPGYGGYSVGGFGSINGARANQNNWQIDGVDNNDFWHNIPAVNQGGVSGIAGVVLPVDAIDEFSSQTQSGAESGRNAGGTVNLVIKSGSNSIHGSAYYYNRNEFYGAASPFFAASATTPKAPPVRNQNYGFSLGGPFVKNKLFYFASFEKQQYLIGLSGVATEPSDAWIGQAVDLLNNPTGKYGSYSAVTPSSLSCANPSTSGCTGGLMGPGGFWPRDLIGGLPGTNNNFFSPVASTGYSYNGVAKVDYQISDKHHLYVRFFGGQGSQTAPLGGSPALGTASSNLKDYFEVAPLHVFNESAVLNSTFSTRLTNQILVGANYFNQVFSDFNNSFDTKAMGLFLSPGALNKGVPILGAPNIVIGNFEQIGLTPPEGRSDLTYHITDIVSYSMGAHQLRFGGEFRRGRVNEFYHRRGTGKFVFDGSQGDQTQCVADFGCTWASSDATMCNALCQGLDPNVKALADFLAGSVSTSSIAVGNPERTVYVNAFNLYFQDAWQVTKKLSLNYGLRYEYFGPLHNGDKDTAVFTPDKGLQIQGAGIDSIFPPDKNNLAPRLGFAYQARNDLVVRGNFGVYYDQININPFLDFRPPANAADGLQDNPIGPHAVSNYSLSGYNWQTVQNGGGSVFPDVATCSTLNVATQAAGDNCGNSTFAAYAVSQNFRAPYFYNYSLQVEKSLGNASMIQIGYVGSQGRKLNIMLNINGNGELSAQYPNAGNILQENSIGTSNYNALQATYRLRAWHGLSSQVSYTWSHSLDEISQYRGVVADSANIKVDYGNSDNDTRHLFTTSVTYEVPKAPWAQGWSSYLVNGWQLSSLLNFHTGQPWNVTLPFADLIGDPFKSDSNFTVKHSFTRDIIQSGQSTGPGVQWVNPDAFGPPTGAFGNLSRNKYYGPGFSDVDFSVFKTIPVRERLKIQLRAEMYNIFNRVNFASGPGAVNGDGTVRDTIGDFNGAPGIGPGEAFNMVLAAKIIF